MIVVDSNVLAYLLIPGQYTTAAERLLEAEPDWAAPRLWRSEVRNILATYLRNQLLELNDARALLGQAAALIGADEYEVETGEVLRLARQSACSAYDCEFVALAQFLGTRLVTADAKLARAFPASTSLLNKIA